MIASLMALALSDADDCRHVGDYGHIVHSPVVVRPGTSLEISLVYRDGPDGFKPVPARCIGRMRVTGPARLERGQIVRVRDDAAAGATVRVEVRIGGVVLRDDIQLIGRDAQVLTGRWSPQSSENCRGREPAELVFSANGYFTYTFPEQMVETMVSGSGEYRWDPASGSLDLGFYHGTARREGRTLTIEGIDFEAMPVPPGPPGTPEPPAPPPCRMVLAGG